MGYAPVSQREETVAKQIVNAAYLVHKQLGPGLLEKVINFNVPLIKGGIRRFVV